MKHDSEVILVSDDMNRIFKRQPEMIHRQIAGENLVVPMRGNLAQLRQIVAFNPVADFIWDHLDGTLSLDQIAGLVREHFESGDADVDRDVLDFIEELMRLEMINQVDS